MSRTPFRTLSSHAVVLQRDDIDTDQIIPARFLTTVVRDGLGKQLFADWRYHANGAPREEFALNRESAAGAQILVAGRNFGCGSSREHAPWALGDWGIRAIVATSFADIFSSNANRNGIVTAAISANEHEALCEMLSRDATLRLTINLETQQVSAQKTGASAAQPDGSVFNAAFPVEPFVKRCLIDGVDELGFLLSAEVDITAFEQRRSRMINTRDVLSVSAASNAYATAEIGQ